MPGFLTLSFVSGRYLRWLSRLAALSLLACPVLGQSLSPPAQAFVLNFAQAGVAYANSLSLGSSFTMETWVSLDAASPYDMIMGKPNNPRGSDPYMNYEIGLDQSGTHFVFVQTTGQAGTYTQVTAPSPVALHTWTHVAAVLQSGTMSLYINGQLIASGSSPGSPAAAPTVPFGLGGAIPDGQNPCCFFNGALRQSRVWSRALTAAEINTYGGETLTGGELGLVADWPLDDGSGSPRDIGPQHLTLTLGGSPVWEQIQIYDSGPYWNYQTFQSTQALSGGGTGAVIDMDANGVTAITAYQESVSAPGPAKAFRWGPNGFADVTSTVLPDSNINVLSPRDWAIADFNGDGRLDVFLAAHGLDEAPYPGGQSHIFIQSADGQLVDETTSRIPSINNFTHTVAAADINGDGTIDLYLGNINGGNTGPQLYINDGAGNFTPSTTGLPDSVANRQEVFPSARFLDVNNDGFPDLVLGSDQSSDSNLVLLNDGYGKFLIGSNILPPKYGGLGWVTVAISPADYDGDGHTDLILVMTNDYQGQVALQLLINNGDGTFRDASSQIPQNWSLTPATQGQLNGSWIQWVVPCDINSDGWIDFITAGGAVLSPHLFINQGGGHFVDTTAALPTGGPATQVLAGGFSGDGNVDLFFDFGRGNYGFAQNIKPITPAQQPGPGTKKPAFSVAGITNAASYQSGAVAPGEIIAIFGSNLGPSNIAPLYTVDGNDISKSISGTRMLFNNVPAPMIYTVSGQIAAVVPYAITGTSTATAQLEYNLKNSHPVQVPVEPSLLGLFAQNGSGTGAGAILNGDGSLNSASNPAATGSIIVLFGTGEGQTSPPGTDGLLANSVLPAPIAPVSVTIGGMEAHVAYAGAAPTEVAGVLQVNVVVPAGVPPGSAVPVVVKIGGSSSQAQLYVSVGQ